MRNSYSNEELAAQLKQDLAEGESWHTEFKEYDYKHLDAKASAWKDELADELAAFASIGGKVYIGISDGGTIKGIDGSHQIWLDKVLNRAMGRIEPKIIWKSYYFTTPRRMMLERGAHSNWAKKLVSSPRLIEGLAPFLGMGADCR